MTESTSTFTRTVGSGACVTGEVPDPGTGSCGISPGVPVFSGVTSGITHPLFHRETNHTRTTAIDFIVKEDLLPAVLRLQFPKELFVNKDCFRPLPITPNLVVALVAVRKRRDGVTWVTLLARKT